MQLISGDSFNGPQAMQRTRKAFNAYLRSHDPGVVFY